MRFNWSGGALREDPVRQPEGGGEEDVEGPPAGRERAVRGVALAFLFESWFTLSGVEGAHEKGGFEGEVGLLVLGDHTLLTGRRRPASRSGKPLRSIGCCATRHTSAPCTTTAMSHWRATVRAARATARPASGSVRARSGSRSPSRRLSIVTRLSVSSMSPVITHSGTRAASSRARGCCVDWSSAVTVM